MKLVIWQLIYYVNDWYDVMTNMIVNKMSISLTTTMDTYMFIAHLKYQQLGTNKIREVKTKVWFILAGKMKIFINNKK